MPQNKTHIKPTNVAV